MLQANCTLETCESTNDRVRMLGETGYPHGTWLRARVQTRGRGRHARVWESQSGNLYLSVLVRNVPVAQWSWVPLGAAIAVIRVLNHASLKIKWPNDLYIHEKQQNLKVGGILCEGVSGQSPYLVVGLGLNFFHEPDQVEQATCLHRDFSGPKSDQELEIERVRKLFLAEFDRVLSDLSQSRFDGLRFDYDQAALYPSGTRLKWNSHAKQSSMSVDSGDVIGLGPHGELQVLKADGEIKSLFSEEVMNVSK